MFYCPLLASLTKCAGLHAVDKLGHDRLRGHPVELNIAVWVIRGLPTGQYHVACGQCNFNDKEENI